jgi:hypothetical protein
MTYCERVPFLRHQHFYQFYTISSRVGVHVAQGLGCTMLRTATRSPEHNSAYRHTARICTATCLLVRGACRRARRSCIEAGQVTRTLPVKIGGLLHFQRKTCLAWYCSTTPLLHPTVAVVGKYDHKNLKSRYF